MEAQNGGSLNLGSGSQPETASLNSKFRIVKQMQAETRPSLKNLAPHAKSVREMGTSVDMGSEIGMTQINTAESTKIQAAPEIGKGSIFDIVF